MNNFGVLSAVVDIGAFAGSCDCLPVSISAARRQSKAPPQAAHSKPVGPRIKPASFNSSRLERWIWSASKLSSTDTLLLTAGSSSDDNS
jgi:hypothetical protein